MKKILSPFIAVFIFSFFCHSFAQSVDLKFSHKRGIYTEPFSLRIIPDTSAEIRYTLNGKNPAKIDDYLVQNDSAIIFVQALLVNNRDKAPGYVVRAYAYVNDSTYSEVKTNTYLFVNQVLSLSPDNVKPGPEWMDSGVNDQEINYGMDPEIYNDSRYRDLMQQALLDIPSVSVVTNLGNLFDPDSGIYVNAFYHGKEWEREASLELLNPDGSDGFQADCGIRIRGGWSRHPYNPKRAFRFIFRGEYGEKDLDYPLFGDEGVTSFDNIDLRTAMNYSWSLDGDSKNTFLREVFSRDTQKDMGQPYTRSRYYHLYINGTYWGLYQTQERSEADFAASYFGGSSDDYDVVKVNVGEDFETYEIEATDGSLDAWFRLWSFCNLDLTTNDIYFRLQGLNSDGSSNPNFEKLLDVNNLIDYMLITMFVGDFDGPISGFRGNLDPNNFYTIYNRNNPDGFKFFRHDAEHSMLNDSRGYDRTGPFPAGEEFYKSNPQWIHQQLSQNPLYRLRFADRVYKHFFNSGALTFEKNLERINNRKSQIELAIIAESARWGDAKSFRPFTKEDWQNEVNFILNDYLPNRAGIVLSQLIGKNLYSNLTPPQFVREGGIIEKGSLISFNSTTGEIYYTVDGTDPLVPVAFENSGFEKKVIDYTSLKKVLVPSINIGTTWRSDNSFNDNSWQVSSGLPGGIGYENGSGYESLISFDSGNLMHENGINPNPSCYIRIPFQITQQELDLTSYMRLTLLYDDGFVIYLNGTKVAEAYAPSNPSWNSTATDNHEAVSEEIFDISSFISSLKLGENLLTIHGLNISTESSDFLVLPELTIGETAGVGVPSSKAIKYDSPFPIERTTTVKARTLYNNSWSALNEQIFIVDEDLSALKITELHYHPLEQDSISHTEYEFIELKNTGNEILDLTASYFADGIDYKFETVFELKPNEFVVLASDSIHFIERYGFSPDGEYENQLSNGGETITFVNAAGDTVFTFQYFDEDPWPNQADGDGYSLVSAGLNPGGNPDDYTYWRVSGELHGSPGMDDVVSDIREKSNLPTQFILHQNYPNPFNPSTNIDFELPIDSNIKLKIYDVIGREVKVLFDGFKKAGRYSIKFDAAGLASGIYFVNFFCDGKSFNKKIVLLK
ncbi:MAG: CotH kinase family protein [Melioribacteraceae bacterium]|nr:CotH kinase family protein [Melioribacteraceae bacterium]